MYYLKRMIVFPLIDILQLDIFTFFVLLHLYSLVYHVYDTVFLSPKNFKVIIGILLVS